MINITLNGATTTFDGDDTMPLLWFLRDVAKKPGTKFGCGIGSCGACTVHIGGVATRSCVISMSDISGAHVTTIEGLGNQDSLHAVQRAWIEMDVPQCGYCQAGQIMAVVSFLENYPDPTNEDIDTHLHNLCRCGTYTRMRKAIHLAAQMARAETPK